MDFTSLQAYELMESRRIEDVASDSYLLRHKKTGAKIAVLSNHDENKVFYIAFRTTPQDETGVAHIIEHTVLCGSEKFPVKDPFIELAKGSLNTFLNAMTYPDKTVYPIASCNEQDFKNLMDVYLDAVFHPNITRYEEIFKQEGWHYSLEKEEGPLTINGVVYSEMKGAYSSPEEVLSQAIMQTLFPDTTYGKDSGGNPAHIPDLTYQAYLDFYHTYYHPSNAYIYLYGDLDIMERLEYLDRVYLSNYDALKMDTAVRSQKAFDKPLEKVISYPISMEEEEGDQTYLSLNFVPERLSTSNPLQPMELIAASAIDYALFSAPGAPIRQRLIDAGIGEDVYGNLDDGIMQPFFSVVAKNANLSQKEEFKKIIMDSVREFTEKGIDKKSILASLNSREFRFREADFGQFPKGLLYGLDCLDSWLYDEARPFDNLALLGHYEKLKKLADGDYYELLLADLFLNHKHQAMVCIVPEKGLLQKREDELAKKLEQKLTSMTGEERKNLIRETEALRIYQEEPSSEEDLAKIPMLDRKDIRKNALPFHNRLDSYGDIPILFHDIETNGICYISFLFDAEDLTPEELPYAGLLRSMLGSLGTGKHSYLELANEVNFYTGGIDFGYTPYSDLKDPDQLILKFDVRIKVLEEHIEKSLSLLEEILFDTDYCAYKRMEEKLLQTKTNLLSRLSSSGHSVAATRGEAGFSKLAFYGDTMNGISFYKELYRLEDELRKDPAAVGEKLKSIAGKLFGKKRLLISFTGQEQLYRRIMGPIKDLISRIPEGKPVGPAPLLKLTKTKEAFTDSSQIQYVAKCGNFRTKGFAYSGHIRLLKMILALDYLWNNVRVLGGAYGCMNSYTRDGDAYFVSYRDPNLEKTLEVFDGIPEYIRNFDPDERDMTKYVIGCFGGIDTPMNPEALGLRSLRAYYENVTFDLIQQERDQILSATKEDIRKLAPVIEAILSDDQICVVGNESAIHSAGHLFDRITTLK